MDNVEEIEGESVIQKPDRVFTVGIGASAGGLEALERFFANVPEDTGLAYVVVQHLSPDFKSLMNELLARHTNLPIHRVENNTVVEADSIYLIPPKKNMTLLKGRLCLTEQDGSGGLNLPIDFFFRSLAQECGKRGVAVVLSGTGSDGSRGIQNVHEAGGLIVAQDVDSAGFDGMPRNAVGTGIVDVVTSPEKMAAVIKKYADDPLGFRNEEAEIDNPILPGSELTVIFRTFRSRYGIDFTLYRSNTVHRRIERRMRLVGCEELTEYVKLLNADQEELDALYRDLLVEVTRFFRDPSAYEKIKNEVIPALVEKTDGPRDEIRLWIAGCATGEEAYSLAMLVDDCSRKMQKRPNVKVFATDVHRDSLEIASAGIYSAESVTNVPDDLRDIYFQKYGGHYHITRELRQMVIFAPHDITKDPPFTRIDLISCRNVLIYLDALVQRRVISMFHFGMRVDGVMMLGPSESVGELSREFGVVDQHWRIFRKLRDVRLPDTKSIPLTPALTSIVSERPAHPGMAGLKKSDFSESSVMEDLLDRYVPPSFLVNKYFELVHSFGNARRLLTQPKGRPTLELLKMVEGDLRVAVSAALHRSNRGQERVVLQGVRTEIDGEQKMLQIVVEPYKKRNQSQDLLLVCLEELKSFPVPEPGAEDFQADNQAAHRLVELERELEFTKESLQSTVEELESSNEEMQSTNEELVASNEELQSTNEELHSVNEELYTVNAEHQRKIDELTQLTMDMDNLLRCTEIGTVFLDRDLRIRKFTPSIASAFHILEQDIGRPIDQFAYNFDDPDLLVHAHKVMESGESFEKELQSTVDQKTYLKRISPYRTSGDRIDGVVITFDNITIIKHSEQVIEREQRFRSLSETLDVVLWVRNAAGKINYLSPKFEAIWNLSCDNIYRNSNLWLMAIHEQDRGRIAEHYDQLQRDGTPFNAAYRIALADGKIRWILDRGKALRDESGEVYRFVGVSDDITEQKIAEENRQEVLDLYENLPVLSVSVDAETKSIKRCSKHLANRLGWGSDELIGRPLIDVYHPDCHDIAQAALLEFLKTGEVKCADLVLCHKDGSPIPVSLHATAIRDKSGEITASRSVWFEKF